MVIKLSYSEQLLDVTSVHSRPEMKHGLVRDHVEYHFTTGADTHVHLHTGQDGKVDDSLRSPASS